MTEQQTATLQQYLERAYFHAVRVNVGTTGVPTDPTADCVASGFDRGDLERRLAGLVEVEKRCIVSKVGAAFLRRVLALMPATSPAGTAGAATGTTSSPA